MAEFIEKETLIQSFDCNGGHFVYSKQIIDAIVSRINLQPVIDAVEVVRCKDCIYHNVPPCPMRLSLNWTNDNDYCSYGERRS